MTNDQDTPQNTVAVYIGEMTYNVNPELLREYKGLAFEELRKEAQAKDNFKGHVEALEATTNIPKAILSKWLKALYTEKDAQVQEQAKAMEELTEVLEA